MLDTEMGDEVFLAGQEGCMLSLNLGESFRRSCLGERTPYLSLEVLAGQSEVGLGQTSREREQHGMEAGKTRHI